MKYIIVLTVVIFTIGTVLEAQHVKHKSNFDWRTVTLPNNILLPKPSDYIDTLPNNILLPKPSDYIDITDTLKQDAFFSQASYNPIALFYKDTLFILSDTVKYIKVNGKVYEIYRSVDLIEQPSVRFQSPNILRLH